MSNNIKTRIQNKHGLEVDWLKATGFIPLPGELIIYDREVDSTGNVLTRVISDTEVALLPEGRLDPYHYERIKIGDGIHVVSDLPFVTDSVASEVVTHNTSITAHDDIRQLIDTTAAEAEMYINTKVDTLIGCGTSDPDSTTTSQFYFKYSLE